MKVSCVIPTLNAGTTLKALLLRLSAEDVEDIVIIDSGSSDNTPKIAKAFTDRFYTIDKKEFNHGLTRNYAVNLCKFDTLVFLTQDAIPQKGSVALLAQSLRDQDVAICFGRQLPNPNAKAFSKHLRYFNYPNYSIKKTLDKKEIYGIKLAFNSNSFAAYKKNILQSLGGFPKLDFCEDIYIAAKALVRGYSVYYNHLACVYHSHNFSLKAEFKRYRTVGHFYKNQEWILETFGATSEEGLKYIKDQIKFLAKKKQLTLLPEFFLRDAIKFFAYKIS